MANISFTIPDNQIQRLLDALARKYDYQDTIWQNRADGTSARLPNPESKQAFVKRSIREEWAKIVQSYETQPPTPPEQITIT